MLQEIRIPLETGVLFRGVAGLLLLLVLSVCAFAVASALPGTAFADEVEVASDPFDMAAPVELEDGEYLIDVSLSGGTGKADIPSPVKLEVSNGVGAATLVWTSPNYDYMLVGGKKYLPTAEAGEKSTFLVPVTAYDEEVAVVGDTTAMSEPHEVDYTLAFDSGSIRPFDAVELPDVEGSSAEQAAEQGGEADRLSDTETQEEPVLEADDDEADDDDAVDGEQLESDDFQADGSNSAAGVTWPWAVFIACAILSALAIGISAGVMRNYRG